MAKETVQGLYEALVRSAKEDEHGEKPILLMAILRYMNEKNVYNTNLLELLRIKHTRYIKRLFLILADRKRASPESSWDRVSKDGEMKSITEKYVKNVADVSEAIANLKPKEVLDLYNEFMLRYSSRSINQR